MNFEVKCDECKKAIRLGTMRESIEGGTCDECRGEVEAARPDSDRLAMIAGLLEVIAGKTPREIREDDLERVRRAYATANRYR